MNLKNIVIPIDPNPRTTRGEIQRMVDAGELNSSILRAIEGLDHEEMLSFLRDMIIAAKECDQELCMNLDFAYSLSFQYTRIVGK